MRSLVLSYALLFQGVGQRIEQGEWAAGTLAVDEDECLASRLGNLLNRHFLTCTIIETSHGPPDAFMSVLSLPMLTLDPEARITYGPIALLGIAAQGIINLLHGVLNGRVSSGRAQDVCAIKVPGWRRLLNDAGDNRQRERNGREKQKLGEEFHGNRRRARHRAASGGVSISRGLQDGLALLP